MSLLLVFALSLGLQMQSTQIHIQNQYYRFVLDCYSYCEPNLASMLFLHHR